MAFANFIKTGTYTNIQAIYYCKQDKQINFKVVSYLNNTKKVVLQSSGMYLDCYTPYNLIKSITQNTPPLEPTANDAYLVGDTPTGEWENHTSEKAVFDGTTWTFTIPDSVFFCEEDSKYYTFFENQTTELKNAFDERTWNEYFTISKIGSANTSDLLKQIYTYLKTRFEFSEVTDC